MSFLLLTAGFVALIFGADKLVDGASSLASQFGIPNIVIGLTIVAFGTSAPELVVNVFASISGNSQMVLGNVIGSNIFNILAILGIASLISPLTVKSNTTWLEIPLSLLAAIAVLVIVADNYLDGSTVNLISRVDGIILLFFFIIFLVYNINVSKTSKDAELIETKDYTTLKSLLFIAFGLAGLIIGGKLIVMSATDIAQSFGISERVISLTIVSIGTSLPELATSIVAVRKRNVDIAIGNVVGSNIFNVFFILGISAVINPFEIASTAFADIYLNILVSLLLFTFIFTGKGKQLERWEGIIFLLVYFSYIIYLIA